MAIDSLLFTSGGLFTSDYLAHGIRQTPDYIAVDADGLRAALEAIFGAFPRDAQPNEAQTEDDLIWPVLAAIGWTDALWRLYWAGARSVTEQFMEIDLAHVLGLVDDDLFATPDEPRVTRRLLAC